MSLAENESLGCDPQAAAEFLRALAHPSRLQILCRLLEGEAAVAMFESEMGLKQPNLSQQLGLLREAGLVTTRREAKSIFYSLADTKVRTILEAVHEAFRGGSKSQRRRASPVQPLAGAGAKASKSWSKQPPATRPSGECGVFSAAGWHLGSAAIGQRGASDA